MKIGPDEIVALMPARTSLHKERKHIVDQMKILANRFEEIDYQLSFLDSVTEVYKKKALHVDRAKEYIDLCLVGGNRSASVYLNAHNHKTWGISITLGSGFSREGTFLGSGWPSQRTATIVAKRWVAEGIKPSENKIRKFWRGD
jgi:hypothetical protein